MVETVEVEAALRLQGSPARKGVPITYDISRAHATEALCRLIEERRTMEADHQAFREKVSDVAYLARDIIRTHSREEDTSFLDKFILPPPVDPLVEAVKAACEELGTASWDDLARKLRELGVDKIERTEA